MLDIGFQELLLIFVIGLLVLGPERLPTAIRTVSVAIGRLRRSFNSIRDEIEREVGAADIRADLHNEEVMASLDKAEKELGALKDELTNETASATGHMRDIGEELNAPLIDPDKTSGNTQDKTPEATPENIKP